MVLIISVIVSIFWIGILKRFDTATRFKGNRRALSGFFFYGMLSVPVVFLLYRIVWPFMTPMVSAYPQSEMFLVVGPTEELSKFIVFYFGAVKAGTIKEPKDGVLHAASVGLAFAIIENILYSIYGLNVLLLRSLTGTLGHMSYAAIWGYASGVYIYSKQAGGREYGFNLVISSLVIAALLHGLYNYTTSEMGLPVGLLLKVVTISVSLWSLSYLGKLSPFQPLPYNRFREAIPELRAALYSNPDSYHLHRRIGLHLLYAGLAEEARKHLKKASQLNRRDLSTRLFLVIIDILSDDKTVEESGRDLFRKTAFRLSIKNLKKLRREIKSVLLCNPGKELIHSIIDDVIAEKSNFTSNEKNHKSSRTRSIRQTVKYKEESKNKGNPLETRRPLAQDDPVRFKKKVNAVSRIIETKKKEMIKK